MKFTLISYFVVLIVMIFVLNKMVGLGNELQDKVLGTYTAQMEEMNEAAGMEIYDLDRKAYTAEELEILKEIY